MDHAPVRPSIGRQADPGAYACSPSPANASPRIVRFPFIGTGIGTGSIRVQWWRCAAHSALPRPVRGLPSRRAPSECAAPASTAFQAGVWVWTAHVGVEDPNADLDARWTTKFAGRGGAGRGADAGGLDGRVWRVWRGSARPRGLGGRELVSLLSARAPRALATPAMRSSARYNRSDAKLFCRTQGVELGFRFPFTFPPVLRPRFRGHGPAPCEWYGSWRSGIGFTWNGRGLVSWM